MADIWEGWWSPNVKAGQVHDHPEDPGRGWSVTMHRECERVYTKRRDPGLPYDPELALAGLAEHEARGNQEEAIADALRGYADEHDRRAANYRADGWKLRERLVADGVIRPTGEPSDG